MPYSYLYDPALRAGAKILGSEIWLDYVATTTNLTLSSQGNPSANCLCEVTSLSPTITLPTAVNITGQQFNIKNSGSGTVTLATTSGQTIDGQAVQTLTQYQALTVVSNGSNWIII